MVQTEVKLDPHCGITVIFRSKRGDRLKILVWDGTGMVLIYKVLEQGGFAWPKVQDATMRLQQGSVRGPVRRVRRIGKQCGGRFS